MVAAIGGKAGAAWLQGGDVMALGDKKYALFADCGYVQRFNGWVFIVATFEEATHYDCADDVPQIGHAKEMGGKGMRGRVVTS